MYERNAIVLERYFYGIFNFKSSSNLRDNYYNYRKLFECYGVLCDAKEKESTCQREFDEATKEVARLQKNQEKLYNKSAKFEYSRYIIFCNTTEKTEDIEKHLNKVNEDVQKNNEELRELGENLVKAVSDYNQKEANLKEAKEARDCAQRDYDETYTKAKECYDAITEELLDSTKQFIKSDNKDNKKELQEIFEDNGKKERNQFDPDVISNTIIKSLEIYKIEMDIYLAGYDRISKLFEEIETDAVKTDKHTKYYKDSKAKLDFLSAEKDYIVQFLDNERIGAIYDKKAHRKLMLEACKKFVLDFAQIEKLYDIIIKEAAGRSTKKIYKENYNKEYLIDLEESSVEPSLDTGKMRQEAIAFVNLNYWRAAGMQSVYSTFEEVVTTIYEKDLSEFMPEPEPEIEEIEETAVEAEPEIQVIEEIVAEAESEIPEIEEVAVETESEVEKIEENVAEAESEIPEIEEIAVETESEVPEIEEIAVEAESEVPEVEESVVEEEAEVPEIEEIAIEEEPDVPEIEEIVVEEEPEVPEIEETTMEADSENDEVEEIPEEQIVVDDKPRSRVLYYSSKVDLANAIYYSLQREFSSSTEDSTEEESEEIYEVPERVQEILANVPEEEDSQDDELETEETIYESDDEEEEEILEENEEDLEIEDSLLEEIESIEPEERQDTSEEFDESVSEEDDESEEESSEEDYDGLDEEESDEEDSNEDEDEIVEEDDEEELENVAAIEETDLEEVSEIVQNIETTEEVPENIQKIEIPKEVEEDPTASIFEKLDAIEDDPEKENSFDLSRLDEIEDEEDNDEENNIDLNLENDVEYEADEELDEDEEDSILEIYFNDGDNKEEQKEKTENTLGKKVGLFQKLVGFNSKKKREA